ncbi:glycosyl hydrolases family 31-domain-containing protein [Xylogone sp. PMI_703]|nr:glycosyl hydrolases family 31-domain-containing protein [Xylogone sp. PMI_703]
MVTAGRDTRQSCSSNSNGKALLEEYVRNRDDLLDPKCSAICVDAREFRPNLGADYHLTARFESLDTAEKIYGMGQYQQPHLDLKGHDLKLAHRNSQASVPFALSSRGYSFLWNNPQISNVMRFEAYSTKFIDYWVVAGDSPTEIVQGYAAATGTVPMMPEYGLGFWQCKLRYQTQEELLAVAREYKRRELPIDLILWRFDVNFWPDPEAMVTELTQMGIQLMVSIWPTVDRDSENNVEMLENGYLIRVDRGYRTGLDFEGTTIHYDATNPGARAFLWEKARLNYYSKGIKVFWLDEAEPEYTAYDFDNYRYWIGTNLAIGNLYPVDYARTFYEGMESSGQKNIVNLLRCAGVGSQRYGALVWSGDIASSWSSFRNQLAAGLNMGLAGLPWWTTDIGGFHGGDPHDPEFRELFVRWFQWGTFCPVMRLHGDREPRQQPLGTGGGANCASGADNEVWSYGDEVFEICKTHLKLREEFRETCFYEFPADEKAWEVVTQYMYGEPHVKMEVYLPGLAVWRLRNEAETLVGGQMVVVDCPINIMPVFERLS